MNDFSLTIGAGEFVGVMGEPGCGKSTAAIGMMGLVRPPGRIVSGEVHYLGRDMLAMNDAELDAIRGKDIGLIVQSPRTSLHPMLTIGRQIENVYLAHNRVSRKAAHARAIEMLQLVGINDPERRVKSYPHELSTGMSQRVLIAMAMSSGPKLLIADEPTSGLDVTIQAQFLDQMWETANRTGSAVLLVTQNLGIVANYCDRVVIMEQGEIVEASAVRDFFTAPAHDYSGRILSLQRESAAGLAHAPAAKGEIAGPLVSVEGLSKDFDIRGSKDKVHAADDVSFDVHRGEAIGLVGESGSGKTTVGRCIVLLEEPTRGTVRYRDEVVSNLTQRAFTPFRNAMQIVFQDPTDSMNPRWSVEQVLTEPLNLHTSLSPAEKRARVTALLDMVGIDPAVREVKPRQLGAGRQQRIGHRRARFRATEPAVHRARRADLGAEPGDTGGDHRAPDPALARARHRLSLHLPRSDHGGASLRPGRGDVSRPGGRDRHTGRGVPDAAPPLFGGAAGVAPLPRHCRPAGRQARARDAQGRDTESGLAAGRLLSLWALPEPGGALPGHAAGARRGFGRPLGALLACGGRGANGLELERT